MKMCYQGEKIAEINESIHAKSTHIGGCSSEGLDF
jgi:hypothetical protein